MKFIIPIIICKERTFITYMKKRECMAVSVKEISREEVEKMSMVDVANVVLLEEKQPLSFLETFNKVAAIKEWEDDVKKTKIAQFYTDLNMDGRFITNGSNTWGLKRWYKLDEISEELTNPSMEVFEEDEEVEFLKTPGFDDEEDDKEEAESFDGFDDPEEVDDEFDDEYDEDEEEEDFGEVFDDDEDEN